LAVECFSQRHAKVQRYNKFFTYASLQSTFLHKICFLTLQDSMAEIKGPKHAKNSDGGVFG
jgi:hypothetical protein